MYIYSRLGGKMKRDRDGQAKLRELHKWGALMVEELTLAGLPYHRALSIARGWVEEMIARAKSKGWL